MGTPALGGAATSAGLWRVRLLVTLGPCYGARRACLDRAEAVAEEALATDAKEAFLREKLAQGVPITEAYPPGEAILKEYEARRG